MTNEYYNRLIRFLRNHITLNEVRFIRVMQHSETLETKIKTQYLKGYIPPDIYEKLHLNSMSMTKPGFLATLAAMCGMEEESFRHWLEANGLSPDLPEAQSQ